MNETMIIESASEADTLAAGATLAKLLGGGQVVYLSGDLGVGKTTLVRGLLRAMGFDGRVKSPSYGLIESYGVGGLDIHHLDLYRLGHGEEILYLGLEDLLGDNSVVLIEWPERGSGWLPDCDRHIHIEDLAGGKRRIRISANRKQC